MVILSPHSLFRFTLNFYAFIRHCILLLVIIFVNSKASTQPLSAFTNIQNQVMVWDDGLIRKIDYLQPVDMKIGRSAIAYLDNSRSFKVYYKGGLKQLNNGFTNAFQVTDNLVTFLNAKSLNVFEQGRVTNLSLLVQDFYVGDSLVMFLDGVRSEWKAYYKGLIYPLENFLAANAIDTAAGTGNTAKASDNIAAYVNYANQFHIFYQGNILTQEEYRINGFQVGRNTVGYVDINRFFKVFHKGNTTQLDDFPPQNYWVGDNLVAYTSNDGYFRVFYNDSVYTIGFFQPDYQVGDNVVAFRDVSGYLKVFYKGEIFSVDTYYPENMTVQYNSLAYINRTGMLRLFSYGQLYDVTNARLALWDLRYDVIKYRIGQNMYRIFYKGEEYY